MTSWDRHWLKPWQEVKSGSYYLSPRLVMLRRRYRMRTIWRPMDAWEAEALVRETLDVHQRFEAELEERIDRLFNTLFGPSGCSKENGSDGEQRPPRDPHE